MASANPAALLVAALLTFWPFMPVRADSLHREVPQTRFVAFYESWGTRADPKLGIDIALAHFQYPVDVLALAFAKPDANFPGGDDISGLGLNLSYGGAVLRSSIAELRRRLPGTKVVISVGGEDYQNWIDFRASNIARFVQAFGLDGVDLDFEPIDAQCSEHAGAIECDTDGLLTNAIRQMRAYLPTSSLSLTAASVGVYGHGKWLNAPPRTGSQYGVVNHVLSDPKLSAAFDYVTIMAYDAGDFFDPLQALASARSVYSGPLLLGLSPPPENWGDHAYTVASARQLLDAALRTRSAAGAMLYGFRKTSGSPASPERPDAAMLANAICDILKKPNCGANLPPR